MMRRLGGVVVIIALIAVVALPAFGSTRTYADDFSSGGYGGSTGSASWAGPWSEIGESNGASSGSVTVDTGSLCDSGDCLVINALVGGSFGAQRTLDMTGSSSGTLSYHVDFPGGLLISGTAVVDARADNGSWVTLASHNKGTKGSFQRNLPAATSSIDIRLRATGLALGTTMGFDSVVVSVEIPVTTTTSTTSTTSTTRPILTIPTTITLPPLLTTTTTTTTPGAGPPGETTTTTNTTATVESTTSTTRPDGDDSTSTTTDPRRTSTSSTTLPVTPTNTSVPPEGPPPEDAPEPPPPPPSETFGVVTRLDPGITLTAGLDLTAQDRFLVRFIRASENISFDILMNLALGIILAWASLSTMQRKGQ